MVQVRQYQLFPTDLIPNSPRPLLHYKNVLARRPNSSHCDPAEVWDMFSQNGWNVQWIFRYGQTQLSHYHSKAHECMAVLSGTARIRFGVADTSEDLNENTYVSSWEEGGIEVEGEAGDVFIIPAGVAHKTYDTRPEAEFKLLTPGTGHGIEAEDPKKALAGIKLSGYTMMGAYNGGDWDFVKRGGDFERCGLFQNRPMTLSLGIQNKASAAHGVEVALRGLFFKFEKKKYLKVSRLYSSVQAKNPSTPTKLPLCLPWALLCFMLQYYSIEVFNMLVNGS